MMKKVVLLALITNQALAADISKLGSDLGKAYRLTQEVEVRSPKQEEIRKQVSAALEDSVLKITFMDLNELKEKLRLSRYGQATESLPTLEESLRYQSFYQQYEAELAVAEKKLMETFYSTSPYLKQLESFRELKVQLQETFSPSTNMAEGHLALESMLDQFEELGFRWVRRPVGGKLEFILDLDHLQKVQRVTNLESLQKKDVLLKQVMQGPARKFNYLKSAHPFLSSRFGVDEFEVVLRELVKKLRS